MSFCVHCGNEFTPDKEHPYQKFCCSQHRKQFGHQQERPLRTQKEREARGQIVCGVCGILFTTSHKYPKYCSDQCRDEAKLLTKEKIIKENKEKALLYKGHVRSCLYCGAEFNTKFSQRSKYCSERCAHLYLYGREEPKDTVKLCDWCGKEFETRYSDARACCYAHSRKLVKWERRQRMRAIIHSQYSRYEIFSKDNFVCHICGSSIDMDAVAPAPLSPSIDHVVPISKGGDDTFDNVKAAHFICNSIKSDRLLL